MGRWDTQDNNPDNWVGVASEGGFDRDSQTVIATDILIQQKGPGGERVHLGFDEYGNQVFENRR